MDEIIKILLLEDNQHDAELIHYQISKNIIKYEFKHVSLYNDFSNALDDYIPDIILSDYNLPGFTGLDALDMARQKCPLTPFIIVTGTIDEETAAETIKMGAWDYVVKERLSRLSSAMKNALELKDEKAKRAIDKEKLRISEERYKLSIEGSQDGIWDRDLKTNEIYFSSRWKSMLGYENNEIVNTYKSFETLLHPDDRDIALSAIDNHLKRNTPFYHVEFRLKCKNGSYKWIFARGKALFDKDGIPYRIAGSHTDISEQKKMEYKLVKAKEKAEESDRLKSAFLANMSHEIRTPMNGILGFASLLNEPNLSGESQKRYIKLIEKSGTRMLNLINNIVSISKIESGLVEVNNVEFNINEQQEYLYNFFKPEVEAKKIDFSFKSSLSVAHSIIKTDKEKFLSVLTNLIKNAIKYTERGSIEFGYNLKGKFLEFYIKDTGIGIESNRQGVIFDRFIQADIEDKMAVQGAGLGLSISKAYVEILGGEIWVESEIGKGSIFYFTIPFNNDSYFKDNKDNLISENDISNRIKNLNILLVEDDEISRLLINAIFKDTNCNVIQAKNGIEAVEICKKKSDIDLILMDIRMPKMDGYEATRQIRTFNKDVIIIAQTAFALSGDKEKSIEAGCNDYIKKPIRKEKLFSIIIKSLSKFRSEHSNDNPFLFGFR